MVTPRLVAPLRPDQVRLPTDRIADPQPIDVLTTGDSYRPVPLAPIAGALPAEAASAGAPPQAAASQIELPAAADTATKDGDGYDY